MQVKRRHYLLLEVLIAFMIIVFCLFPIIAPNVAVVKAQKSFSQVVELDHTANLVYADILENLYRNQGISLSDIQERRWFPVEQKFLEGLPYTGKYQFEILRRKPPPPAPRTLYEVKLSLLFLPQGATDNNDPRAIKYSYKIFIEHQTKGSEPESGEQK